MDSVERVLAVVSGYRPEYGDVFRLEELKPGEVAPPDKIVEKNSKRYRLVETGTVIRTNSGIIVAYDIQHAIDLIKKNPIGPMVT